MSYAGHDFFDVMSDEEAAMLDPAAIALHTVIRGAHRPGDAVAVIGPGVMGLLVAECAYALGAGKVIVVGGDFGFGQTEIYDPGTGTWSPSGKLTTPRTAHTATLITSGPLVVGGYVSSPGSPLASSEIGRPG